MPTNPTNCNNCGCTPNPLDSGNWESESTARSASTSTTPPDGSPSGGGECKVGFKDGYICKPFQDGTYDAGANLHPDTNCRAEDLVFAIQGDAEGAEIDSASGVVTFGPTSALIIISVACGNIGDTMTLRYAKIEWIESEVVLEWHEQPSGVYSAASNVDTTNGGAMPDHWTLEIIESEQSSDMLATSHDSDMPETDATIDSATGVVTFGSKGQCCEITGTLGGCDPCGGKFQADLIKLGIERDKSDVTRKVTSAFAGEKVTLTGVVAPPKYSGTDWQWSVPGITIKKWEADANLGKRVDYTADDWKKKEIEVHWVDGTPAGLSKIVTVAATVNGKQMTAETIVQIKRPEIAVKTKIIQPWFQWVPAVGPVEAQWAAKMAFEFSGANNLLGGKTQWVQLGQYSRTRVVDGIPFPYFSPTAPGGGPGPAGLDGGYPYAADGDTQDNPTQGFPQGMELKSFSFNMRMWLMWKSPKGGEWVPISSVKWVWTGTIKATQPYGQQKEPVWLVNPEPTYDLKKPELDYPTWTQRLVP